MRTTIRIDDEVYRRVKRVAESSGRTIGQVIEDAIQIASRTTQVPATITDLPTCGGSGVMPGVDLSSNAALAEVMDEGTAADALR